MTIKPFPSIEKALQEIIGRDYPPAAGHVGGDLSYDGEDLYVMITLVGGSTNRTGGFWTVDITVFGRRYGTARDHAAAIEALLLDFPHRSSGLIIDSVFQNDAPHLVPWGDDEDTFRLEATYVVDARRSG